MHPTISAAFKVLGLTLIGLVLAALLPLGELRLPVIGAVVLALGLGCFWLVSLAYLHGQIVWRTDVFYAAHDRFYFWFYLVFYALAGLLCIFAGTAGLLA
jgi:hypothetical protein